MTDRTIFLVRHGERHDHVAPEWVKTAERPSDTDLSERGRLEAEAAGHRLESEKIDHVISSPFLRTMRTAEPCARLKGLKTCVEYGIGEQLKLKNFADGKYPSFAPLNDRRTEFPSIDVDYVPVHYPEGLEEEGAPTVGVRSAHVSKLLLERFEGNLAIFTHYPIVNTWCLHLIGDLVQHEIRTASITRLDLRGSTWEPTYLADARHLDGI